MAKPISPVIFISPPITAIIGLMSPSRSFCKTSAVKVIAPVGYLNMVWLIDNCKLVMTDSGGLQKEAFFFAKPCITLRDETEWVELIEHNFNILVGADKDAIIAVYNEHVFSSDFNVDLYGNGLASSNIINALINYEK